MRAHVHILLLLRLLWLRGQRRQMIRRRGQGVAGIRRLRDRGLVGRVGRVGRAERPAPLFLEPSVSLIFVVHGP
ncbi:hypothetical protein EUGRSUZ_B00831 [Eucalyptus grandis]|uniref:Uncharacterized protein n=2 Tax=Eucalyptus grandis TaxID=71139 RepID=A0ACC3LQ24_EUCGR|nr:hypothetical protein EUGRSUZ_B00831 [Eucalyptus grandis]